MVVWMSYHISPYSVALFTVLASAQLLLGLTVVTYFQRNNCMIPLVYIIATAIMLRAIVLLGWPLFEDDFFRYLFDGYMTASRGDPYSLAPAVFFADETLPENVDALLSRINFPEIATVYGPVTQWIFAASWSLAPASVWPFQLTAGLADLVTLLLLANLCRSDAQRNFLLLYAWSPLLIKEFSLTAHPDIYAITLCIFALWLARKDSWFGCGIAVALAAGAKVFAVLMLPLLAVYYFNRQNLARLSAGFVTGIILITLSFGTLSIWFPEGLSAMARHWVFNAPLYRALGGLIAIEWLKVVAVFALAVLICWQMWVLGSKEKEMEKTAALYRGQLWIFAGFLLCLPALNPWYLCWLLPFAVLWPSRWPFIWSILVLLAYYTGFNLGGNELHRVPTVLIAIQFVGVIVAILLDSRYPINRVARHP